MAIDTASNKKQRLDIGKRLKAAEMAMCACMHLCIRKTQHTENADCDYLGFTLDGKRHMFCYDSHLQDVVSMSSSATTFIDSLCVINPKVPEAIRKEAGENGHLSHSDINRVVMTNVSDLEALLINFA